VTDTVDAAALEPLLTGSFGHPYRFAASCPSTQDMIKADEDAEGTVVATDEQTAGRGRLGRRWDAPAGKAILCSVLLRPPGERHFPELSLVTAVAVADAAERALGLSAQIKWPNDVLVNRKKVAGILAEARGPAVVVGIGINVNQTREELPPASPAPAASLFTIDGVERDRAPILADVLARLEHHYTVWRERGLDGVYIDLGSRDFLRGREISVDGVAGKAIQIDRRGRLEVETADGTRTVESGEVTYEQ
jgi:BirA family biotin operon repressor/biotin-[acetyl-CoA-carboxylase] ligase